LRGAGCEGTILPWRDVLYEGPVPAGLSVESLREIRARYIAGQGWGDYRQVLKQYEERDDVIREAAGFQEIFLWFESDLHDQLQLLQVLDLFGAPPALRDCLFLLPLRGSLATLPVNDVRETLGKRENVMHGQSDSAAAAWAAFRSPDPSLLESLAKAGFPDLPSLGAAVFRLLQQYPSTHNGLSLSEHNALEAIAAGRSRLSEVFVASHHEREQTVFLGDRVFASYLEQMSDVERPLLVFDDGTPLRFPREPQHRSVFWERKAILTRTGEDVLKGKQDNVRINGIRRWIGGVYLTGNGAVWRWDAESQSLHYR
jgi:hypothetical protein